MENRICIKRLIKDAKTSPFALGCAMEIGYGPGLPILQVYPIRYTLCLTLPEGSPIGFEDLSFDPRFQRADLSRPVGLFRHEAIRQYGKKEYAEKQNQLYDLYDKTANMLVYDTPYTEEDEAAMSELLRLLVTPELLPIYRALDPDFYSKYLG